MIQVESKLGIKPSSTHRDLTNMRPPGYLFIPRRVLIPQILKNREGHFELRMPQVLHTYTNSFSFMLQSVHWLYGRKECVTSKAPASSMIGLWALNIGSNELCTSQAIWIKNTSQPHTIVGRILQEFGRLNYMFQPCKTKHIKFEKTVNTYWFKSAIF